MHDHIYYLSHFSNSCIDHIDYSFILDLCVNLASFVCKFFNRYTVKECSNGGSQEPGAPKAQEPGAPKAQEPKSLEPRSLEP